MKAVAFSRVVVEELGCGVVAGGELCGEVAGSAGVTTAPADEGPARGVVVQAHMTAGAHAASTLGSGGEGRPPRAASPRTEQSQAACRRPRKRPQGA